MKKEYSMDKEQNTNKETSINWWAIAAGLALWSLGDYVGQRQALEDARTDRFLDSIDRISHWF